MYKYSLVVGSKKIRCPKCGEKRFVQYKNNESNDLLPNTVGRCDREINCGYHFTPNQYFKEDVQLETISNLTFIPKKKSTSHPDHYVERSLKSSDNFTKYLYTIFTFEEVKKVIETYKIGTSTHWKNSTIFWQIDNQNRVRAGKVILYDKTGHRSKYATWIHSILLKKKIITTYHLNQCLFGLHLINTNTKPIAIVESEKTACIMSIRFPKYLWLATGGSNNIADKYFTTIKNRPIILFPDLSIDNTIFEKWNKKTIELQKFGFNISSSTLLENIATKTDKQKGLDIADYFLLPSFPRRGGFRPKEDDGVVSYSQCHPHKPVTSLTGYGELGISSLPKGELRGQGEVVLNKSSTLPLGKMPIGRWEMGKVLSIPQQTLNILINKNPFVEKLIKTFDLLI